MILIRLVTSQGFLIALVVFSFTWATVGASWTWPPLFIAIIASAIRRGLGLDAYAAIAPLMRTGTQTKWTHKTGTRTTTGTIVRTHGHAGTGTVARLGADMRHTGQASWAQRPHAAYDWY